MYKFIEKLCHKLCHNLFEQSSQNCIVNITLKEKLQLLLTPSTELKIKINRKMNQFCKVHQNRFWIIYYRLSEKKIAFSCKRCYKTVLCEAYILSRIIRYVKAFNIEQESSIFQSVRKNLIENAPINSPKNSSGEVALHYTQKILKIYKEKALDRHIGSALIENILERIKDKNVKERLREQLERYKLFQATIIMEDILTQALQSREILKVRPLVLIELLHQEKFLHYIQAPIQSRFIDFTRSKTYTHQVETKEQMQKSHKEENYLDEEEIEELLSLLLSEDRLLYKLKHGLKLNSREFLTIGSNLEPISSDFTALFNSKERLYIKFSLHHKLEDDSEHFKILGELESIKISISEKILNYRKKLEAHSYIEGVMDEIAIKLIYTEPLSVKEVGKVVNLSEKQVYKKIAKIKEKLKEMVTQ